MELSDKIDRARVPRHIAVIMDGNGRWAQRQGEMRVVGHSHGVSAVRETLMAASEVGVRYLTLYAFSTENWNRPQAEVNALMDLLVRTLMSELDSLNENGVRLNAIGDLDSLPGDCRETLQQAIDRTSMNDRITLTLALSYSARWEMVRMVRRLAELVRTGDIDPADIEETTLEEHLCTIGLPDPELLVRTSGEQRISNFLLWQIAYAELYFTDVLWPDFKKDDLFAAIIAYQNRERRFGKISEQVSPQ
ncbi:MAG: isoprenyl transferase [Flavobacteriales bacterium]|nr:isoprenyl transferase [Flavobacteriales bacterium]MCB9166721.1 isoprenyl transferase [Flavobacteriales bacterium]